MRSKNSYVLILFNQKNFKLKISSFDLNFKPGFYYYVGSLNSFSRILRHFKKEKKKKWHIDYISELMIPICAVILKEEECNVAGKFKLEKIPKFGCSDCSCDSHLFYSQNLTLDFLST
ncbi:MAG: DUF123 domain-containing protein [Archaeoglobaceae archaeon]|nr:DUF123 domain-containing protein [Archaeoglobaceae archaeon]MCX8152599.1 DUF123 domain-containing protein [Archaeoglobaceae archaeon]MDW8014119.1 DUF123 domain-containing protein [Archaeoglobaceae archaeon]